MPHFVNITAPGLSCVTYPWDSEVYRFASLCGHRPSDFVGSQVQHLYICSQVNSSQVFTFIGLILARHGSAGYCNNKVVKHIHTYCTNPYPNTTTQVFGPEIRLTS